MSAGIYLGGFVITLFLCLQDDYIQKSLHTHVQNREINNYTTHTKTWEHGLKGIFSDSNNIFLRYESEDINKNSLFPKFQLIPILGFQVMHDYVCSIAPIDYCVE